MHHQVRSNIILKIKSKFFLNLAQTVAPLCSTAQWNSSSTLITGSTGSAGNSPTLLSSPYDVTFDKYQNVYVADFTNHRIQQYRYGQSIFFFEQISQKNRCF